MEGRFYSSEVSSADLNIVISECLRIDSPGRASMYPIAGKLNRALRHAAKVISLAALTLAIIIGIYETLLTPSMELILRAGLYVSGYVFLAMAVDSQKTSTGWLLAATGIALPVLSYLGAGGNRVFTILAMLLVALWAISSVQRR